jgi:diguanylate cyclase (GGDEF)-like protein
MSARQGPVVMVIEHASSYQTQLAAGLSEALEPIGIPLLVHLWGPIGTQPPAALARLLLTGDPRAVLITPLTRTHDDEQLAALLARRPDLPRLFLGTVGPGCSVRADNEMGMRLVARHLVRDCQARRILVVRGIGHHPDSQVREQTLRAELGRLGVPVTDDLVVDGLFQRETARRVVQEALERDHDIDAIAALNDRSALGAVDAVVAVGRRVPEDIVVTGFDDEDFARLSRPSLTTVSQNFLLQGSMAAELLLRLLAGERLGEVRVPVQLETRGSTLRGRAGEIEAEPAAAHLLWGQVAAMDVALGINRSFMTCDTLTQVVDTLAVNLPRLGIARGFLVLRIDAPGPERGILAMSFYDGQLQNVAPETPFDLSRLLPETVRHHLNDGTLVVQPLAVGETELGYLILDQVRHADNHVAEALRMDLSRAIDTIQSTARLSERTRQLETEVASRRATQQALVDQAHHDPLTGLPNRLAFLAEAESAVAGGAAMMLVDLDRFKDVNDTLGHAVGDALLREVGTRLVSLIGQRGTVSRLGGDEFAILAPGANQPHEAMALAREVVVALRDHFRLEGLTLEIDGSVGVACAPQHPDDAARLLQMADVAMYDAKCAHTGASLYDLSQQVEASRRLALFGELRRALADHELVVHYQPIIDVAGGRVSGVEALVRWDHPTMGMLPPSDFLEVAEQTGLIHPLTTYVLDCALRDCRRWMDQGLSLVVAVNLSARRLMDVDLPQEVALLLNRHQIPPASLVLEITESAAMADPNRALSVLRGLRDLGVHLSVDDFGTGHASLAYLGRLPVSSLKIDKSFVLSMESDLANMTIVRSTLDLARNLGLRVIAEGVETSTAYQALTTFGCDHAQGFWLARPTPAHLLPGVVTDLQQRLEAPLVGARPPRRPGAEAPAPALVARVVPRPRARTQRPADASEELA